MNCFFAETQKRPCYVFFGGEEGSIFEEWRGRGGGGGGVSDENDDKFYLEVYLEKHQTQPI